MVDIIDESAKAAVVRVELVRQENRGSLHDLVGLLRISHFALQLFGPLLFRRRDTGTSISVN